MAVTVKPKQIVRAKNTDAAVFTDYKGAGLQKIAYTATKKGDSLGEATGNSFPGTGVDFDWIELIYIIQTSFIFGLPTFERKLGYVPSMDVYFEDPAPSTVGTGTTTNPSSGSNTTPSATQGGQNSNVSTSSATDKVIHKKGGLPRWAIWSLAGLGVVSVFLAGYLASNKKKTQKK